MKKLFAIAGLMAMMSSPVMAQCSCDYFHGWLPLRCGNQWVKVERKVPGNFNVTGAASRICPNTCPILKRPVGAAAPIKKQKKTVRGYW